MPQSANSELFYLGDSKTIRSRKAFGILLSDLCYNPGHWLSVTYFLFGLSTGKTSSSDLRIVRGGENLLQPSMNCSYGQLPRLLENFRRSSV